MTGEDRTTPRPNVPQWLRDVSKEHPMSDPICLTEDEAAALRDILAMLATIVRAERAAEQFAEMCPVHTFIRLADCEVHGAPHE